MKYLITLVAVPMGIVGQGWVISILWGWFMVPQFGLTPIDVLHGIAIGLIASTMSGSNEAQHAFSVILKDVAEEMTSFDTLKHYASFYVSTIFLPLLIGWVVMMFMH